ncbi:UNVERIFIED_CONTAM: Retrovirus-related Pol polyprotein from transposon 17.6 [Sesamum indicum]
MLVDERAKRQVAEEQTNARLEHLTEAHEGLHSTVMNIEHTLVTVQQLKSVVIQLQNYNRNKSVLGEGLTATMDKGSSSRVAPQQTAGGENTNWNETGYSSIHKMEFPLFNGEDARAWIRRCTCYFQMIPIPEGHKTALASIHMQGRAKLWYYGYVEKRGVSTWQELIVNVMERFEDVDYERVFEELEAQMLIFNKHLGEEFFMMKFISRLKEEIKGKTQQSLKSNPLKNAYRPVSKTPAYKPSYNPAFKARNKNSQPRRLLTEDEMRARRERNLCYNCDEVFVPGHKCKLEEQTEGVEEEDVTMSIHAMCERIGNGTLRIRGQVNGKEIHILIDSGSTHSFIDEKVVKALNLKIEEVTPMKLDYDEGTITVTHKGREIILKAMTRKTEPKVSSAGPLSELLGRRTYSLVHKLFSTRNNIGQKVENPLIMGLLQRFEDVFQVPQSLPPERPIEHKIDLMPDAIPRKQLPYRLLMSGIIRASQSSFASPVLLVKKKDGAGGYVLTIDILISLPSSTNSPYLMRQEDISKTNFITHSGHYEFLVMPFGLCNAPATFQELMNQVFEPFLRKFVLVFFDDILIYSKSWNDHLLHLRKVLELLRVHKLYAKKSKCTFAQLQIEYLGHIISEKGVATDPQKVQFIREWPVPTSLKALRGFLALTGYYRKFIKESIQTPEGGNVYSPVLALLDFTKPFVVETDASGRGIGAVLMQEGRPIAYLSKALEPKNLGLSTYEKEFLALLLAVTKWKHYLQGAIQEGKSEWAADALSRVEYDTVKAENCAISTQLPLWMQELHLSYAEDTLFQLIIQAKVLDAQSHPEYDYHSGVLRKGGKICVGSHGELRKKIIQIMHDSALGGHSRITGTLQMLKLLFFGPNVKEEVNTWVKECKVCQQAKSENKAYPRLLQPLPIPEQAWACISMDFIEGLPKSDGKEVILVIVDRLTKYSHFISLEHPYTAVSIARIFSYHIYQLHGLPVSIVTDKDKIFTSHFWKELFSLTAFSLDMSTTYHPQTDGRQREATPFEALYGYPPNQLSIGPYLQSHHTDVEELMKNRVKVLQLLKENLQQAQQRMKVYANKKRIEREFNVGDEVLLKLQPYKKASVALRKNLKLSVRYFGPYPVIEKVGKVAYRLALPPESKIHPVFHVSLLKKKIGSKYIPSVNIPDLEDEVYKIYPLAILARRLIPRNNVGVPQVLIH